LGTHIVGTCRIGNIFHYLSQKLGQVRNFATSDYIQIMVINIDAFRKSFTDPDKEDKANIIHRPHDRMTGNRPIEFVQATNPIVIIDEPQSVDTTSKSKEAIAVPFNASFMFLKRLREALREGGASWCYPVKLPLLFFLPLSPPFDSCIKLSQVRPPLHFI
jgi:hypothetical protein